MPGRHETPRVTSKLVLSRDRLPFSRDGIQNYLMSISTLMITVIVDTSMRFAVVLDLRSL